MTLTLFISLVTILSLVCSLFTEAFKISFKITKPTIVVGILSCIIGWAGGICAYLLMGIVFNTSSIICLILLAPTIWLMATLGYDKVMEVIKQIGKPK